MVRQRFFRGTRNLYTLQVGARTVSVEAPPDQAVAPGATVCPQVDAVHTWAVAADSAVSTAEAALSSGPQRVEGEGQAPQRVDGPECHLPVTECQRRRAPTPDDGWLFADQPRAISPSKSLA